MGSGLPGSLGRLGALELLLQLSEGLPLLLGLPLKVPKLRLVALTEEGEREASGNQGGLSGKRRLVGNLRLGGCRGAGWGGGRRHTLRERKGWSGGSVGRAVFLPG